MLKHKVIILCIAFFCGITLSSAQKSKQDQLEERRQELRNEIRKINNLLFQNTNKKKSEASKIEDLNYKLEVRRNLIKVTNEQANLLTREINSNQNKISDLNKELEVLKANYAKLLVKSYKNKNTQSRIMFLLSSNNFKQAYKRLQYINQYSDYQKKQGENITEKTNELLAVNKKLIEQKKSKDALIEENRKAKIALEKDVIEQKAILALIQKDLDKYSAEVREKQKEVAKIDKEISDLIKAAIAKSNKKAGVKPSNKVGKAEEFALTAESKALAADFLSNKGKLPWPVEKGIIKLRYGRQPHPIDKSLQIESNGVRIATETNAKVRAVFNGEVLAVQKAKLGSITVLIQHGNYVSSYTNLGKVYVSEGEKVSTKQDIGEIFTNPITNETILRFSIFKNSTTQNPALWIYKM
ncbi:murein hydrolase activator EnvC family protein [Aurantibacter aestuarii]|uniref:Peptidase M23 n=1 Tax=Aurantibacter aestuarii TaxID=1266046 RepID=A0A2T1NCR7_9FLAO|nr:peptidoglycan DD-metalloendopeptidase family protein [Aurantibacter aestuarii]PSG90216.1 peptidase M23 [Aurantibacter aestuarii]